MNRFAKTALIAATMLAGLCLPQVRAGAETPGPAPAGSRPNIIVVLVDDMGFSDVGAFGSQEIRTPNLDALATEGARFANFHATPVCAPTRAELLTGVDHHLTGIGNFPELIQDNQKGHPGYEGYLVDRVATIAERLRAGGYTTFMSGKWHLGYDPRANPAARGFQHSFALLGGGHNHFGLDPAFQSTMPNAGTVYTADGRRVAVTQPFYSTDAFTRHFLDFLPARAGGAPFFGYLAFTAPHYPLQAPPEDIARYAGKFDMGYDALRTRRIARERALGLTPRDAVPAAQTEPKPWATLTPDQKRYEARLMEVYAAMVDRVDQNIGKLVAALKARGLYDNTLIVFLSDNGAEGHQLDHSVIAAEQGRRMLASADNRLDSIGTARSFIWYGPNWAEAATAPSRLYKSFPTEGGTRVPAFIWAPSRIRPEILTGYASVRDITPTLLDYAQVPVATTVDGHPVLAPQGASLRGWIEGRAPAPATADIAANGEMFGRLYARRGALKAVMIPPPTGPGRWQLYDVVADPGEANDLATVRPGELAALVAQWNAYAKASGVVPPAIPGN